MFSKHNRISVINKSFSFQTEWSWTLLWENLRQNKNQLTALQHALWINYGSGCFLVPVAETHTRTDSSSYKTCESPSAARCVCGLEVSSRVWSFPSLPCSCGWTEAPGLGPSWYERSLVARRWNQVKETFRRFLEGWAGSFLESTGRPCLESLRPPLHHLWGSWWNPLWGGSCFSESCGMWDSWEFKAFSCVCVCVCWWVMDAGRQSTMSTTV